MLFCLPGSDKEAILELITSRSNRQRQEICQSYKSLYGKVTMATVGQVGWAVCSFRVSPVVFQLSLHADSSALPLSSPEPGPVQPQIHTCTVLAIRLGTG